ncbi:MAG: circadian clock KaiB family protein [Candidatus Binatia bacterium]
MSETSKYILRLYISGATERSKRALGNIKKICERHVPGRYELRVIDIFQTPDEVTEDKVIVAPTLVKKLPLPVRRCVGDLSDTAKVVSDLAL